MSIEEYLKNLEVGDVVQRMLAGVIPMNLQITDLTDQMITTGGGWTFDRKTGIEIDDMISVQVSHLVIPEDF